MTADAAAGMRTRSTPMQARRASEGIRERAPWGRPYSLACAAGLDGSGRQGAGDRQRALGAGDGERAWMGRSTTPQ